MATRSVALYINRTPRLYRLPTIVSMKRAFGKRGLHLILAVEQSWDSSIFDSFLNSDLDIKRCRGLDVRNREGFRSSSFNVSFSLELLMLIMSIRPKVIVQEGFADWGVVSVLAKYLFGSRIVCSFERNEFTELASGSLKRAYQRWFLRNVVAKVVVTSARSHNFLVHGLRYNGMTAVGNVLPYIPSLRRRQKAEVSACELNAKEFFSRSVANQVNILTVMQLIPRKGVERYCRIVSEMCDRFPHFRFLLVGAGVEGRIVSRLQHGSFLWISSIDSVRIYELYSRADFFMLPTLEDNWSLACLEAAALGVINIVGYENGVVPEPLNSCNSLIVNFDSINAADEVGSLIDNCRIDNSRRFVLPTHLSIGDHFTV
jgi:glycosyltransferase involved in cell wall biosynthesis